MVLNLFSISAAEMTAKLKALDLSQAIIEFKMDGTIITANQRFLDAMGYALSEIRGRHHSMFVDPAYAKSAQYAQFWEGLRQGRFQSAEYKRFGKNGKEVWIQASYNPIMDRRGRPYKVVKFAMDVTRQKMQLADYEEQIDAIGKSQAVIHFELDGTIITANDNFLRAVGYALDEIRGRHHSMFVDAAHRQSAEYRRFWESLRRGEYQTGEYKRVGKGGREVWIQASYNPILDADGRPFKIVKFATNVTAQVQERLRRAEIGRRVDADLAHIAEAISTATAQAANAVSASTQTTANVQTVASASEELVSSVGEISRQTVEASRVSAQAVSEAERTNQIVGGLAAAADKIGEVVSLITQIASQTNLLALNATIEAARAGDAGKGFAVVANEVKSLANQTAKATDEIAAQIAQVQGATTEAVNAIGTISQTIKQLSEISGAIASATEEQNAVAREISSNMQTAATAVNSIGNYLDEIAQATKAAEDSTRKVKEASRALAG